jgi:hypothetical protein
MMSTFVMMLAAGLAAGDAPSKVSVEVAESLPTHGEWQGRWTDDQGFTRDVALPGVVTRGRSVCTVYVEIVGIPRPRPVSNSFSIADEGRGDVRMEWNTRWARGDSENCLGIYRWDKDRLIICFRVEGKGRPKSFRSGDGQHLLRLRRVN